jgi:hypothetical protein
MLPVTFSVKTAQDEDSPKPCPFCGGDAILNKTSNIYESVYFVTCDGSLDSGCAGLAMSNYCEDRGDAYKAWNTRAEVSDE